MLRESNNNNNLETLPCALLLVPNLVLSRTRFKSLARALSADHAVLCLPACLSHRTQPWCAASLRV
jgi:hypothetical protein